MTHPIEKAAEIIGSESGLAFALGVTKSAVNQWKAEGRRVPAEHVLKIESLTDGAVTRNDLRPDIYPIEKSA